MQTFLPYPNFSKSAACLDNKRLGKQRVEVLQILSALNCEIKGWRNHPAVQMWRGCTNALAAYGISICWEWKARGYYDTCFEKILTLCDHDYLSANVPPWFGNKEFHDSHKSNLLRKNPEWYGQFNWDVPNDLPYVWPTKMEKS